MARFIVRRILWVIVTLFVMATLSFVLVRVVPGGPFDQEKAIPIEIQRQIYAKFHLDESVLKQYTRWLWELLRYGDLGPTFKYPNRSVNEVIGLSLPVSLQLGFFAALVAIGIGLPLGIYAGLHHGTTRDRMAMTLSLLGVSVPRFVLGPVLVLFFALRLYWFPVARWESWQHMVLPVITAGLPMAAYIARLARGGMLEVIRSDFIRTARAKGLPESIVVRRHALPGALLPVVSYLGPGLSSLLVGSVVVEKIFGIPGMGRYFVEAALNRDYNLLVGVLLVYGVILMLLNALVDITYAALDPRIELDT